MSRILTKSSTESSDKSDKDDVKDKLYGPDTPYTEITSNDEHIDKGPCDFEVPWRFPCLRGGGETENKVRSRSCGYGTKRKTQNYRRRCKGQIKQRRVVEYFPTRNKTSTVENEEVELNYEADGELSDDEGQGQDSDWFDSQSDDETTYSPPHTSPPNYSHWQPRDRKSVV